MCPYGTGIEKEEEEVSRGALGIRAFFFFFKLYGFYRLPGRRRRVREANMILFLLDVVVFFGQAGKCYDSWLKMDIE